MCPEPEFGLCYHRLIEYYRPSPEDACQQLAAILERHFQEKERERRGSRQKSEKGGAKP